MKNSAPSFCLKFMKTEHLIFTFLNIPRNVGNHSGNVFNTFYGVRCYIFMSVWHYTVICIFLLPFTC